LELLQSSRPAATSPTATKGKVSLSEDEVKALSESELDDRIKAMENGLAQGKDELKLRMHLEMERMRVERDQTLCMACCDQEKSILLTPCNHICVCEACSHRLEKCPICSSPIENRVKVYL